MCPAWVCQSGSGCPSRLRIPLPCSTLPAQHVIGRLVDHVLEQGCPSRDERTVGGGFVVVGDAGERFGQREAVDESGRGRGRLPVTELAVDDGSAGRGDEDAPAVNPPSQDDPWSVRHANTDLHHPSERPAPWCLLCAGAGVAFERPASAVESSRVHERTRDPPLLVGAAGSVPKDGHAVGIWGYRDVRDSLRERVPVAARASTKHVRNPPRAHA